MDGLFGRVEIYQSFQWKAFPVLCVPGHTSLVSWRAPDPSASAGPALPDFAAGQKPSSFRWSPGQGLSCLISLLENLPRDGVRVRPRYTSLVSWRAPGPSASAGPALPDFAAGQKPSSSRRSPGPRQGLPCLISLPENSRALPRDGVWVRPWIWLCHEDCQVITKISDKFDENFHEITKISDKFDEYFHEMWEILDKCYENFHEMTRGERHPFPSGGPPSAITVESWATSPWGAECLDFGQVYPSHGPPGHPLRRFHTITKISDKFDENFHEITKISDKFDENFHESTKISDKFDENFHERLEIWDKCDENFHEMTGGERHPIRSGGPPSAIIVDSRATSPWGAECLDVGPADPSHGPPGHPRRRFHPSTKISDKFDENFHEMTWMQIRHQCFLHLRGRVMCGSQLTIDKPVIAWLDLLGATVGDERHWSSSEEINQDGKQPASEESLQGDFCFHWIVGSFLQPPNEICMTGMRIRHQCFLHLWEILDKCEENFQEMTGGERHPFRSGGPPSAITVDSRATSPWGAECLDVGPADPSHGPPGHPRRRFHLSTKISDKFDENFHEITKISDKFDENFHEMTWMRIRHQCFLHLQPAVNKPVRTWVDLLGATVGDERHWSSSEEIIQDGKQPASEESLQGVFRFAWIVGSFLQPPIEICMQPAVNKPVRTWVDLLGATVGDEHHWSSSEEIIQDGKQPASEESLQADFCFPWIVGSFLQPPNEICMEPFVLMSLQAENMQHTVDKPVHAWLDLLGATVGGYECHWSSSEEIINVEKQPAREESLQGDSCIPGNVGSALQPPNEICMEPIPPMSPKPKFLHNCTTFVMSWALSILCLWGRSRGPWLLGLPRGSLGRSPPLKMLQQVAINTMGATPPAKHKPGCPPQSRAATTPSGQPSILSFFAKGSFMDVFNSLSKTILILTCFFFSGLNAQGVGHQEPITWTCPLAGAATIRLYQDELEVASCMTFGTEICKSLYTNLKLCVDDWNGPQGLIYSMRDQMDGFIVEVFTRRLVSNRCNVTVPAEVTKPAMIATSTPSTRTPRTELDKPANSKNGMKITPLVGVIVALVVIVGVIAVGIIVFKKSRGLRHAGEKAKKASKESSDSSKISEAPLKQWIDI